MIFDDFNVNKKLAASSFVAGLVVSLIAPDFNFDLKLIKEGMFWGLAIGIFWSLVRFYVHGEQGVLKSQKELTTGTVYLAFFMVGYFVGWTTFKLLALF